MIPLFSLTYTPPKGESAVNNAALSVYDTPAMLRVIEGNKETSAVRAAIYCRLSKDDEDREGESESIKIRGLCLSIIARGKVGK